MNRRCSRRQGDGARAPRGCAFFAIRLDDQGPRPRLVAHRHPRAALVLINTSLDQTANPTAVHLCLECLRVKAKPGSNSFRSDDNRTIRDGDRSCRQHGHCVSFLPEKGCNAEVLPGSKLMQICSISSAASGLLSRAHWYRHGSLLRRSPLRRCVQVGQIPKVGRLRCRATWRSIRSRSLTNWARKWVGSASPASTSNWKGSRARIAFALSVRSTRALRPSVSNGIRTRQPCLIRPLTVCEAVP